MTSPPEDKAAALNAAREARALTRQGPDALAARRGAFRRLVRRLLLRAFRPYSAYQQRVDNRLLDAFEDLERQLDQRTEDLIEALEALRSRVATGEVVVSGNLAVPYSAPGTFEQFRDPFAGVVLGYRDRGDAHESDYLAFEEVFRGPEDRVLERQRSYLGLIDGHEPVLDAGCGRGEFLDLLREHGISYRGVDVDAGMVEHCRRKGHASVDLMTANQCLESVQEESLGAVFSAQVIEHMPYPELTRFLELSLARLRGGGLLVAETVNPHAPSALKTYWVDPTHQHPIFPEVALVLCRLAGFGSAYVFHPLGTGHVDDDRYRETEYAVVARKG
jgi:SAM-dependent methyltransferase